MASPSEGATSSGPSVSADGRVVVAASSDGLGPRARHALAFIRARRSCVDLEGFTLQTVGISDDGRTLAGECCPGFIARLPEGFDAGL